MYAEDFLNKKEKMKILYVANGNGLSSNLGGSFTRSLEIARRLMKMGLDVHFLTTHGGHKACQREGLDVAYHLLPASILKRDESGLLDRGLAYIISTISALWVVPRLPRCDLVYSDSDYFCDVIPALLYRKTSGARWIAMTHHQIKVSKTRLRDFIVSSISQHMQSFSYFLFRKYADGVFTYKSSMGKAITDYMIAKGMDRSKITMVTNGIDLNLIETVSTEEERIFDACFVGGLRPSKGLYDIIPIWKEVVSKKDGAVLVIIGSGAKEYENQLLTQIQREGLQQQIVMVGAKSHTETIKIIKRSRTYISPSHEEGWGIAICEAMACGLPVIAYDLDVYRDVFNDTYRGISPFSISEFAEAIAEFLASEDLRIETALSGRSLILQYDWDLVAKRELGFFKKILELKSKDPGGQRSPEEIQR